MKLRVEIEIGAPSMECYAELREAISRCVCTEEWKPDQIPAVNDGGMIIALDGDAVGSWAILP